MSQKFFPVLLVITLVLAVAVGALWQKVTSLEKGSTVNQALVTPTPDASGKLSEEEAKKVVEASDADHLRGSLDADVILIEYSDLECPFCKQFQLTVKQAVADYKGKLAWVYRHFPLDTLHQKADKEAEASECAFEQAGNDGFWKFIDYIFEVTTSNNTLDLTKLPTYASKVGLDQAKFKTCLDSGKYAQKVEDQYQSGLKAGVNGTPGNFLINKKGEVWVIPGAVPIESLKASIDAALK